MPFVYYNWPGELLLKMLILQWCCVRFSIVALIDTHVVFLLTHHWFPLIIHAIVLFVPHCTSCWSNCTQALVARTTPLFTNFLFTNLFSIKKNYFFIISSLFPYFNLFVSIFIQSYVNIKLHVSTLYSNIHTLLC